MSYCNDPLNTGSFRLCIGSIPVIVPIVLSIGSVPVVLSIGSVPVTDLRGS